jgi:flagellar basal body-associated protein FliL
MKKVMLISIVALAVIAAAAAAAVILIGVFYGQQEKTGRAREHLM